MRRWPRAWRRRAGLGATAGVEGVSADVDNASNHSYSMDMRAVTQISVPAAPDYALRVPSQFQILVGCGLFGGLLGLGLVLGAPQVPAPIGVVLLVVGVLSAAFVVAIGTITPNHWVGTLQFQAVF